jgi:hypothetical protein
MRVPPSRPARFAAGLGAVLAVGVLAGPAAAADFGTAPVTGAGRAGTGLSVRDVTVGRQDTYDRVVFTAVDGLPRWEVRYVAAVAKDGSGEPVPLEGAADLLVVLHGTDWIDTPSVRKALAPKLPALRQVAGAGEFEGDLSYGIGQATKAGFRAFQLTGPDRLVVDVAHPAGASGSPSPTVSSPAPSSVATSPAVPPSSTPAAAGGIETSPDPGGIPPLALVGGAVALIGAAGILVALRSGRRP